MHKMNKKTWVKLGFGLSASFFGVMTTGLIFIPPHVGERIETSIKNNMATALPLPYVASLTNYQRNKKNSIIGMRLGLDHSCKTLPTENTDALYLTININVLHAPFASVSAFTKGFHLASFEGNVQLSPALQKQYQQVLDLAAGVNSGSTATSHIAPELTFKGTKNWDGTVQIQLNFPKISVANKDDKNIFTLNETTMGLLFDGSESVLFALSNSDLNPKPTTIGLQNKSMSFEVNFGKPTVFWVDGFNYQATKTNAIDNDLLQIKQIRIQHDGQEVASLEGLSIAGEQKKITHTLASGGINMDSNTKIGINKLYVNLGEDLKDPEKTKGKLFEKFIFNQEYKRLSLLGLQTWKLGNHCAGIASLIGASTVIKTATAEMQTESTKKAFSMLALEKPYFGISELSVDTPQGKISGNAHVQFKEMRTQALDNFFDLSVSSALNSKFIQNYLHHLDANLQLTMPMLLLPHEWQQSANTIANMGFLTQQNQQLGLNLKMSQGKVTLNGKPVPF